MSAIARAVLGTKAETLAKLAPRLTKSYVQPLFVFTAADWNADHATVLRRIKAALGTDALIVRSSARSEDQGVASNAGRYRTVSSVVGADATAVKRAVETVLASYGQGDQLDQVLVQHRLAAVTLAGVMFTREASALAPYYVFNYDDRTGSTESVTSGHGSDLSTYVRFRGALDPFPSEPLARVFAAVEEIEALAGDQLEIELAVDARGAVCLFQVRPLVSPVREEPLSAVTLGDWLAKAAKKIEKLSRPHPHLHGTRSIFGVMPDWNPAEIIGLKPRALALTLYKEIVTDSIWAYMRDNYGYRNLRSFPLLISLLGAPYIDVRVSFNSFIPKGVREDLSEKLVNYYVACLESAPQAHDKVEFDIVFSCYYPGIRDEIARLESAGFNGTEVGEILSALRDLTNRIIGPAGFWADDVTKIERLSVRRQQVLDSPMSAVDKIYWLLEDCKRYGTLPFSGLARAGFIAVQFLRGFVKLGILSQQDYGSFLGSLRTVTNRMKADAAAMLRGELPRQYFLERYGHLRPGTYDILSARYDEDFDRYFGREGGGASEGAGAADGEFELTPDQEAAISEFLRKEGIAVSCADLFKFIRGGIEGREHAKLVFSRSLSDALVLLGRLGEQCGLTRDDLSNLNIRTVLQLYSSLDALDLRDVLLRDIEANRQAYSITRAIRLPDLILSPRDVFHFHTGRFEPNFVTLGKVSAEVMREQGLCATDLAGKIVCVRAADPGYDWLFSQRIGGLVTQFGGANSHMAIRAAEAGIPAVIGCGEQKFAAWSVAACLEIDCANKTVRVLR
jgi:phosphohistidine swiveling domain-containing protein